MLQLTLRSAEGTDGTAEMYIDYQSGCIGLIVTHATSQFDFSIEEEEWGQFKAFIETKMMQDKL